MVYDLIIIGAGPIGLCCGIAAEKAELNYLIIEKGVLVNSLYNFPTNMTFFSTSKLLEIGEVPFISHTDKPTRRESLEYFRRVQEKWDLKINYYETVQTMKPDKNCYNINTSKGKYSTKKVIVATGFYDTPRLLNIPGEELSKVKHFYDEPHSYIGQKLAVIGAANSGCDVALECYQKGADVTMIVRKPHIYKKVKYWIKPNIENRIAEGSIKAFFESEVVEIFKDFLLIQTPKGIIEYPNDFVLAMTGYKPNYEFLENLGILFNADEFKTPKLNEKTLESNLPGVYLAGVINAGLQTSKLFIENTRIHADVILPQITKNLD